MQQLQRLFGEECFMRDFVTIDTSEKYVTLKHIDTGRLVAYTSEDRLQAKYQTIRQMFHYPAKEKSKAGYVSLSLFTDISRGRAEVSSSL